jgi:uncharacterized protein YciI
MIRRGDGGPGTMKGTVGASSLWSPQSENDHELEPLLSSFRSGAAIECHPYSHFTFIRHYGTTNGGNIVMKILFSLAILALFFSPFATARQSGQPAFEMDTYQLGLLRKGPQWGVGQEEETRRIQSEHLAHLTKLSRAGKLVGAGPFGDGGDIRGILIFKAASVEEASLLGQDDPAVKAGRLALDIHTWWGPKGIGEKYAAEAKADPSIKAEMVVHQFAFLIKGPRWTGASSPDLDRLQTDHLAHIKKMADTGKLVAAGPLTGDGRIRGILIFRLDSADEAKAMAASDPKIKAGHLALELHPLFVDRRVFMR